MYPLRAEMYNLGEPRESLEPNRKIISSRENHFLLWTPTFTSGVIICLDLSLCWKAGTTAYSSWCRPSISQCLAQDSSMNVYQGMLEKRRAAWKLGLTLILGMKYLDVQNKIVGRD